MKEETQQVLGQLIKTWLGEVREWVWWNDEDGNLGDRSHVGGRMLFVPAVFIGALLAFPMSIYWVNGCFWLLDFIITLFILAIASGIFYLIGMLGWVLYEKGGEVKDWFKEEWDNAEETYKGN